MRNSQLLLTVFAVVFVAGCGSGDSAASDTAAAESFLAADTTSGRDLVSVLDERGGFESLIEGIDAAGLGGDLRGSGPYTLLAPSDSAFGTLPDAQRATLFEDSERLRSVLQYHVIPGILTAADLQGMTSVTTLEGITIPVTQANGTVRIAGAAVIESDIEAENGIIHILDGVLLPER